MRTIMLAAVAALGCASPSTAQDVGARADSVMRAAEADGFSGVVRVERNGAVILEQGYGLANRAANTRFTPATVVQIGSNTKDFTAVAILQLKERGLLDLSDPIGKYFPSAPADKRSITIAQLLDHEGGFPIGLGPDFDQVTRQQLIDGAMRTKLLFTPGARRNYSNTGFALLAAIVEQLSGKSYDEYVRDNILEPIGLKNTGFHLPGFDESRLARGYSAGGRDEGTLLSRPHAADGPYWNLRGNGGMLSTVGDMHTFYEALFESDKLLEPETRRLRFPSDEPVALAGSDLVSFFLYERDPGAGVEIIIASNNSDRKAPAARRAIASVLGLPSDVERVVTEGGPPLAQRTGKPASAAMTQVASDLVKAINAGNSEELHRFVVARFATGSGSPSVEDRLERLRGMNANLGALEILSVTVADDGGLQLQVRSAKEGPATMLVDVEPAAPHRIRRIGVLVGGS